MEQQISHFKILEEIGSGGMGVVYRATDLRLRRKVALKVLPAGALAEPTIRERLVREAQTASALNHPHIVTVFEIHSAGDRDFIAMEFVQGKSLDRLIGDDGLPLEQALRYGVQIADGLACAHEQGVIHRDLKPQNIMITPNDEVKILDFGLAKRFLPAGLETGSSGIQPAMMTLTAPGVKVGTPAYMSPEQIESRKVDARSDVFSFGCLLYEMLTGVSPFHRRNAILIFKAVLSDDPEPLRSLKPELPAELEGILQRALEKAPEDRFPSMRELLAKLEDLHVERFGSGIYPSRSGAVPAPPRPRKANWRPVAWAAAALAAAAVLLWLGRRPPAPPTLSGHRLLASFEDTHPQVSLSPDGERVAYVREDERGAPQVVVRPVAEDRATPVTSRPHGATDPSWTRDGRRLLFAAPGGGIWSLPAEGGPETRLLTEGRRPRPSPDGRLVVEHEGALWLAAGDGSGLEKVGSVPEAFFARWVPRSPAFSPDGGRIAYFHPEAGSSGGLWVAPLAGGEPRRLLEASFRSGDPEWIADGRWIVFSADFDGEPQLWCVPARGGEPRRLTSQGGGHFAPTASADARRIAYLAARPSFALELRRGETGTRRLYESRHQIVRPALSPRGERVAFSAPAGPDVHLFTVEVATGEVRQVTAGSGERNVDPRFSADGRSLYFYQQLPAPSLRRIPVEGGESVEVLPDWSRERRFGAAVDGDGRRVAYTPLAAGVPGKLRVRDLPSGEEWELDEALLDPAWSPDGGQVLGADLSDRILLCPASGGECRFLAEGSRPRWAPDGTSITFVRADAAAGDGRVEASIWILTLDGREGQELLRVEGPGFAAFDYGVLEDGAVLWNRRLPGHVELWLAELE